MHRPTRPSRGATTTGSAQHLEGGDHPRLKRWPGVRSVVLIGIYFLDYRACRQNQGCSRPSGEMVEHHIREGATGSTSGCSIAPGGIGDVIKPNTQCVTSCRPRRASPPGEIRAKLPPPKEPFQESPVLAFPRRRRTGYLAQSARCDSCPGAGSGELADAIWKLRWRFPSAKNRSPSKSNGAAVTGQPDPFIPRRDSARKVCSNPLMPSRWQTVRQFKVLTASNMSIGSAHAARP